MAQGGETSSLDLSVYENDPSSVVASQRNAQNHAIAKGPCQTQSGYFPKVIFWNNQKFLMAWYERFEWI